MTALARTERILDRFAAPARAGGILACTVLIALLALGAVPLAVDAHAYWAADPLDPYNFGALYTQDAYFYSPAFTQALGPLHALPWPAFAALWTALLTVVLAWLGGRWFGYVVIIPFVAIEMAMGNVHVLIAAAIVVGFRWPAAWSFILLTKVTPGVGLVWFAVRREWRSLAIAAVATAGVVAVSYAIAPGAWADWIGVLRATESSTYRESTPFDFIPLPVRVTLAAILVAWAGLTDRRWVVPVAATLALPVVYINGLAVLVAAPLLWTRDRQARRSPGATDAPAEPAIAGAAAPAASPPQ
jgi:Glycosyltransferase family 87